MNLTNSQYNQLMYHYTEMQSIQNAALDERRDEVYSAIPELKEIDDSVRRLSLSYVRESMNNDSSASDSYQKEIDKLKERRIHLLTSKGYDEKYLEPSYECPDCKDTGYIGNEKCHCLKKRISDIFYKQSGMDKILEKENFDNFNLDLYPNDSIDDITGMTSRDTMAEILNVAKSFVSDFGDDFTNLLLYGDTGVGKTFLSHCIARELFETGHMVLYLSSIGLFEILEARQFDKELRYSDKNAMQSFIMDSDLLIIDDLGTELTNGFISSELYHVIEDRLEKKKPTIISTNLSIRELNDRYSERFFSRIMSNYKPLKLIGNDIRLMRPNS